jgi:hypothetical protein
MTNNYIKVSSRQIPLGLRVESTFFFFDSNNVSQAHNEYDAARQLASQLKHPIVHTFKPAFAGVPSIT